MEQLVKIKVGEVYLLDFEELKQDFFNVYVKYQDRIILIKEKVFQNEQYEKDYDFVAYLDCIEDESHMIGLCVGSVLHECMQEV